MKRIVLLISITIILFNCTQPMQLELTSPNGQVQVALDAKEQRLKYSVFSNESGLVLDSEISILQEIDVTILDTETKHVNETWRPVWGQFSEIQDEYNELEVSLDYQGVPATLFMRTYDHGVAFRFKISTVPKGAKPSFLMEYALDNRSNIYSPTGGVKEAIGPLKLSAMSEMDSVKYAFKMPLLIEHEQKGFISLLESDLVSAPGFKVIHFEFDETQNRLISKNDFDAVEGALITPWRLILIEDEIGDFLTNTIPLNVAAPSKIEDPSWIRPGKTLWDWRVHGYRANDGFQYGIDNESYFRFIDFAATNNIEYFMIDDGWYTDVKPGHMQMSEKLDLDKVTRYANEKGVSLLLYYDRRVGDYGDKELFPYYSSLEMKGIKYGFMGDNVSFTRDAIRMSAENKLLIDFHDNPVPFTGISRTYPNAITKEFCHAQQDYRRTFTPKSFIRMALINGIQGPLDMNNGVFDITGVNAGQRLKGPKQINSLFTTVAAEAARTLIIFSGLVCIPDAPEAYAAKSDLFEFIKEMPVGKWDESKVLHAKMDEYISTARRHGKEWFIGSVHAKGGILAINLDFLQDDQEYMVTYYEDSEQTNSVTNPEAYQVRTEIIQKGFVVEAKMTAGGGHCMWIRPSQI